MSVEDDRSGGGEDDRVLVAEFALGLLGAAEHDGAARRIAGDAALRQELRLWKLRLAALDREFAETPAPAGAYDRLAARLFPEAPSARTKWWNSLALWRGLAVAGLAVAVLAVGVDLAPRAPLTGPELVAALDAQGSNVKFIAFYWAIKGKNAPVSMGVIPIDAKSNVVMSDAIKSGFGPGTVLAVTLEQKGGSPTGAPQGPVVAAGAATAI